MKNLYANHQTGFRGEFFKLSKELEKFHGIFRTIWSLGYPELDPNISTACIVFDRRRSYAPLSFKFNPKFWYKLDNYTRAFVICHECLHAFLKHGQRAQSLYEANKNNEMINGAMDLAVNHMLINCFGFKREKINGYKNLWWVEKAFPGQHISNNLSFEEYYNLLEKEQKRRREILLNARDKEKNGQTDALRKAIDSFNNNIDWPDSDDSDTKNDFEIDEDWNFNTDNDGAFDEDELFSNDTSEALNDLLEAIQSLEENEDDVPGLDDFDNLMNNIINNIFNSFSPDEHSEITEKIEDVFDKDFNYGVNPFDLEYIKEAKELIEPIDGEAFGGLIIDLPTKIVKVSKAWEKLVISWKRIGMAAESDDDQWIKPSRKLIDLPDGLFLPSDDSLGENNFGLSKLNLWCFLDFSPSCEKFKTHFCQAFNSIPNKRFNKKAFVFADYTSEFDTVTGKVKENIGYGTSFYSVNDYIKNLIQKTGEKPDIIFIITDGEASHPQYEEENKWHWFVTHSMLLTDVNEYKEHYTEDQAIEKYLRDKEVAESTRERYINSIPKTMKIHYLEKFFNYG